MLHRSSEAWCIPCMGRPAAPTLRKQRRTPPRRTPPANKNGGTGGRSTPGKDHKAGEQRPDYSQERRLLRGRMGSTTNRNSVRSRSH